MPNLVKWHGSGEGPPGAFTLDPRLDSYPDTSRPREEGTSRDALGLSNPTAAGGSAAPPSAARVQSTELAFSAYASSNYTNRDSPWERSVNATVAQFEQATKAEGHDFASASLLADGYRTLPFDYPATTAAAIDYLPADGAFARSNMTEAVANATSATQLLVTSFGNASAGAELDKSALRALGITIGFINVFLGSSGNLLTILAIMWNKKLRTTFHIFIANLCAIDFLTSAAMMPFNITAYWTKAWPFGADSFTCSFMAFSYYCCGYTSIVCLLVITVNRFVGIVYPEHYDDLFTRNRIILAIVISWVFAPAFLFPIFFFASGRGYGWYQALTLCVFRTDRYNSSEQNYMQFIRVLFQFLPLIIMGVLYVKIFLTARKAGRAVISMSKRAAGDNQSGDARRPGSDRGRLKFPSYSSARAKSETKTSEDDSTDLKSIDQENDSSHVQLYAGGEEESNKSGESRAPAPGSSTASAPSDSSAKQWQRKRVMANSQVRRNASSNQSTTPQHRHKFKRQYTATEKEARKRRSMDRKLLRISVTICIIFMILFLPSVIVNLIPKSVGIDPRAHMFASVITWFNSCVNPVIYCFMNARMRMQYKLLLVKAWNSVCRCMRIDVGRTWAHGSYNSSFRNSQRSMSRHT